MNIPQLLRFVELYNLGGLVESVKLSVKDNVLSTAFVTDDKSMAGTVTQKSFKFDDVEFGIWDTAFFRNRVKALEGSEVEMVAEKGSGDKVIYLSLKDANGTDAQITTAELNVIPTAPKIKLPPTFELEIPVDTAFIDRFIRVKNSLPDADSFTLKMNESDQLELIVGWSPSTNTDCTKINITATAGMDKLTDPISFNANHFKSVLSANSDGTKSTLKISTRGLAVITFDTADFTTTYYLVQKKLES